ncbi:MAG: hypothetical protein QOC77_3428 [Thermoleophilaceae bacterium]|jgi:hypothetical protein|nr:hypothetical protein [Thermoleophilaceae bacterium]
MRLSGVLLALAATLAFAGPAAADTVGEPQVITDQASNTEPAPAPEADAAPQPQPEPDAAPDGSDVPATDDGPPLPEPPPDASGRRGEIHVLDATTQSTPAAPAPAAPAPAPARASTAAAPQLPFTGPHAGALALVGLALMAAGSGLLAVLRKPAQ